MASVIVVGGGISGLAAATFLVSAGHDVVVLEASPEPGGKVRSTREDGRVLDHAANGWLDSEPAMGRLLKLAGLDGQVLRASDAARERWIYADGRLHEAPLGPRKLAMSRLIPLRAKLRMLLELLMPRGAEARDPSRADDETVGAWVERRLGRWFVARMVGPMVAGIYAADPYKTSLRAAFPRMHELERDFRSLFVAMVRLGRGGQPSGHLTTLPGGAGTLCETLAARLGERVTTGAVVTRVVRQGERWSVHTARGEWDADAVVLAAPGPAQADLLGPLDPVAADALRAIRYNPIAVVTTAWPVDAWVRAARGFGVLVARGEDLGGVLGALFTSNSFPDQAPGGEVLVRTMLGGGLYPEVVALPDEALISRARAAQIAFCGPERAEPRFVRVIRHPNGIPAYEPGHLGRVSTALDAEARCPGLFLVGNHLRGIGVKDCARQAEDATQRVGAFLGSR